MKKLLKLTALSLVAVTTNSFALEDINPGLWKISMESGVAATPDWKPQPFELSQCLTASDAQNPDQLLLGMSSSGATGCDILNRQYSGNTLTFDVSCAGTLGLKGHGQVSFTATSLDGTLDVTMGGEENIDMQNKIHASYLGVCPPK